MKIYHVKNTRGIRVIWLCEELSLPYELEVVDFSPEFRSSEPWRRISPTGKVPAMTDGTLTLFESGAMVEYILDTYGQGRLIPKVGSAERAMFYQWCWFAEATFARPLGEIVNHRRVSGDHPTVDWVLDDCRQRATLCLDALERALVDDDFLVGNEFSAADIMTGYSLMLAERLHVFTGEHHPRTGAYYERLADRPGFQVAQSAG